jgi:hypothetical protein
MILIGLFIGFVLFVVLALLCIVFSEMSSLDWLLVGFVALSAIICGIGASKSKAKKAK